MKITPVEIRNQEFKRSMRGYDAVEVDTFMELIANEYTAVIQENEQLNKQLIKLETELKNFKEVEKTLKQTLYNVQETSQMSKENSQKEAVLLKREAELAATQMLERARAEVQKMRQEVASLHNQKQSFITRLRHILSSQIELLDVLEIDDFDMKKLKDRSAKKVETVNPGKKSVTPPDRKQDPEIELPDQETKKSSEDKQKISGENPEAGQKDEPADDAFFNDLFGEEDK